MILNIFEGKKIRLRAVEIEDLDNYFCNSEEIDTPAQRSGDRAKLPMSKTVMRERVESLANMIPGYEECFMIIETRQVTQSEI